MAASSRLLAVVACAALAKRAHGDTLGLLEQAVMAGTSRRNANSQGVEVLSRTCGINGILNVKTDRYEEPEDASKLQCHKRMTTNCSVSYYPMRCPSDCAFLAPHGAFSCLFECVPPEKCSQNNPNRAFPNKANGLCDRCHVSGCKVCSSPTLCEACHEHFQLSADKTQCRFDLDERANWPVVLAVLGGLIGAIVLLGVVWFLIHGPHPNWELNMVAILRARRHRRLTKVYSWDLTHTKQVRTRYGMAENMHKKNILGVGTALFYNNVVFMCFIAFVFWVTTLILFESSDVAKALGKFEDKVTHLIQNIVAPPKYEPALVLSPLAICGTTSGAKTQDYIMGFAKNNFVVIGILYVCTFVASLIFGLLQKRAALLFDRKNSTMSDYALHLRGLPEDATSEPDLQQWLQEELRKVCAGKNERPPQVIPRLDGPDEIIPRDPSEIEVFGVSVCYNYVDQWAAVDDVMWKEMEHMELNMATASAQDDNLHLTEAHTSAHGKEGGIEKQQEQNRETVKGWFEGPNKFKGSGEAFCVFKYIPDKFKVEQYAQANPDFLRHPSAKGTPVKISPVFSEPNCVAWHFVGLSEGVLIKRTLRNFGWILLVIALVQLIIVLPYAKFVLLPYAITGSAAGGLKTTIAGIVLGNVNGILFLTNFLTALRLGYSRKDRMDTFILGTNTILVLINTGFNILITVVMVMSQNHMVSDVINDVLDGKTLKAVGTENSIARNLYLMLMPGSFFIGLIMAMIMAGWVPFIWNTFLMKVIYIWKCFPDCLLKIFKIFLPWAPEGLEYYPVRSAEKAFEPWEVPICGNYADQIVTPTICFLFLFFVSPYTHKVFLGMFLWSVFEYFYFRYMHLRYHKTCFYTTSRLDSFNNFMWGAPISVIAAACCHWGFRSEMLGADRSPYFKVLSYVLVSSASFILWCICYRLVVDPFNVVDSDDEQQTRTVEELSTETVYTWFNCNTPFVLKCKYYFKDKEGNDLDSRLNGHPIACGEDPNQVRFFEVGKQGLFAKPERQKLVLTLEHDFMEYETWFEKILHIMDVLARTSRCGLERKNSRAVTNTPSDYEMGLLAAEEPEDAK